MRRLLTGFAVVWFGLQTAPALAEETAPSVETANRAELCRKAYSREDLPYVLEHCPEEAWALARAQCERSEDTVIPRYAEFCRLFHSGRAPSYGY